MCKLLEIKYYTVLVTYTFALQLITGAEKKKLTPPRKFTAIMYFEIECSA